MVSDLRFCDVYLAVENDSVLSLWWNTGKVVKRVVSNSAVCVHYRNTNYSFSKASKGCCLELYSSSVFLIRELASF